MIYIVLMLLKFNGDVSDPCGSEKIFYLQIQLFGIFHMAIHESHIGGVCVTQIQQRTGRIGAVETVLEKCHLGSRSVVSIINRISLESIPIEYSFRRFGKSVQIPEIRIA